MKRIGLVYSVLFFVLVSSAYAQDYTAAVGVRFSSKAALINNSISLKYFFSEKTAAEGLISFADPFALGLLIERHQPLLTNFKWFYGAGFYAGFRGQRRMGLHGVAGLDYKLPKLPVNLSIDWKPELTLAKEFSFEPQALGVSARFALR